MNPADVAELARRFCEAYSWDALDPGVSEPSMTGGEDGFEVVVLPRDQADEPFRSFKLIDAVALGPVLMVAFAWADGEDDETVYLMPLDMREISLDIEDDFEVTNFLMRHLEFTLGGPRDVWTATRGATISPRVVLVRSYLAPSPPEADFDQPAVEREGRRSGPNPGRPVAGEWSTRDYFS